MKALDRAREALETGALDQDVGAPYAATILRARRRHGLPTDPGALLHRWSQFHPGSPIGEVRYRWPLTHKRVRPLAGAPQDWQPWRPLDSTRLEDPFDLEATLSLPAVICDAGELLLELSEEGDLEASALFQEAVSVMRRDFASFVRATSAWVDTFALWCLTRRPRMFAALQPLALAIASTYAATAIGTNGIVLGTRFPIFEVPLVSASAHLAGALLALGVELELVVKLCEFVARSARPDGDWIDHAQHIDLLTTLAAADLLSHVDPSFDAEKVARFFASKQAPDGTWTVLGPETPWLTASIAEWLEAMERPFADRFRWPHLPLANRDHKTELPFFAWFEQTARLLSEMPGLAAARTDLAFIDLAGFRAFNNAFGQDRGDLVLRAFAQEIAALPGARAVRDGGDEFLVIGAPTKEGLDAQLQAMAQAWPARFHARFGEGVPPVAPRILVGTTSGGSLRRAREILGREIGSLKELSRTPPPEGILRTLIIPPG